MRALSGEIDVSLSDALEEQGYVVLRGAVNPKDLALAHDWIAAATSQGPAVAESLQPEFEVDGTIRKIRRLTFFDPLFWAPWIRRIGLARLAQSLLGKNQTLILHASFKKPARVGTAVVPHQDQALWDTPYPGAITAWIALEDATHENGCLEMYLGSHKQGLIPHNIEQSDSTHKAIDVVSEGLTSVAVPMKAGDMILWHRYMAHSSGPNETANGRMAMVMVFADAGAPSFRAHDELNV